MISGSETDSADNIKSARPENPDKKIIVADEDYIAPPGTDSLSKFLSLLSRLKNIKSKSGIFSGIKPLSAGKKNHSGKEEQTAEKRESLFTGLKPPAEIAIHLKNFHQRISPALEVIKRHPVILISSFALIGIILILLLTTYIFNKPAVNYRDPKTPVSETIFSGSDKKDIPKGEFENIHLKKGREAYHNGQPAEALAELSMVPESDAKDAEKATALTYIGIIYDDQGNYSGAIDSYNRALQYDRKNPIIYRNLSLSYRHNKDYRKAGKFAGKALDIDDKNIQNRILLGNIYFEQEDYKNAIKEYETVLKIDPENSMALYNLAICLFKKGNEAAAIENLKKAGDSDKKGKVASLAYGKLGVIYTRAKDFELAEKYLKLATYYAPRDAIYSYNLGIIYLKQKRFDLALQEFIKAEKTGSADIEILENLGEAYFTLKNYDRSINVYNRLLSSDTRNIRILTRMAEIYYTKGDLDMAFESYKKITEFDPTSESARIAYLNIGNILDDAERFDEAIDAYNKALAINPKDDMALINMGITYNHAGKPEKAIDYWKKAAALKPDSPEPLLVIADYYYESRNYDMAMDEYQQILRKWPGVQDGHFNLATIYYKKNLIDYAIEEYKRVVEIDGKNELALKAYINLGMLAIDKSKNAEEELVAIGYIQKALLIKPGDPDILFSLGVVYSKKEMFDEALKAFTQTINSSNDSKVIGAAYNNIGKCYYKKGLYKKALQSFAKGIDQDPANEEIRINRKIAMQALEKRSSQ